MSYILEALRKMERQARRDSQTESWVDDLSAPSDEENTEDKKTSKLLVAVSILFGASGILTGLLFYEGNQAVEKNQNPIIQSGHILDSPKSAPPEASRNLNKMPESVSPTQVKGVTLSELRLRLPVKDEIKNKETDKEKLSVIEVERGKSGPKALPLLPKSKTVIDLTYSYRLTSTGEMNHRKYATIERNDYYIGDEFRGMIITDIHKDRVHLKGKERGQPYVIIFRYKKGP